MPSKKSDKSFGASFAELEKIVEKLEGSEVDLEEGIKDFELALSLARTLKARLSEVESQVVEIKKKFGDVLGNEEEAESAQVASA